MRAPLNSPDAGLGVETAPTFVVVGIEDGTYPPPVFMGVGVPVESGGGVPSEAKEPDGSRWLRLGARPTGGAANPPEPVGVTVAARASTPPPPCTIVGMGTFALLASAKGARALESSSMLA